MLQRLAPESPASAEPWFQLSAGAERSARAQVSRVCTQPRTCVPLSALLRVLGVSFPGSYFGALWSACSPQVSSTVFGSDEVWKWNTPRQKAVYTLGQIQQTALRVSPRERLGPAAVLGEGLRGAPALTRHSGCQEAGVPLVSAAVSWATGEEVEIGRVMMPRSSAISLRVALFP